MNPFSDVAPVNDFTWSFGLNLQYPLFLGDSRRRQVQRTKVALLQLQDQKNLLYQQLELAVRSALETASASFSRVSLSQEAAEAAAKNFDIIQDNYSQGLINITSLIDAQNTALQTSLEAENANYQFMIDILNLERRVGFYFFLADPEDRDLFFDRLTQFLSSQE
ncbi:MAG: TolC family protein [Bacteroidota bacterium]